MRAIIFQRENLNYLIVFFTLSQYLAFFQYLWFLLPICLPCVICETYVTRINACIRSPAKNPASLEKAGQARLSAFLVRLTRKRRPGKAWQAWPQPRFLGNLGHQSLAYLALLLPRPTFLGNPGQKSPTYNPGLKDSSHAWPGFFEFPGQKFIPLSDCNMKPQNLWPFVVPWRTLFSLQLLFFHKEWHIVSFHI